MTKRVLLTGATGFIGRHTIPELIARGYEVHAVSSKIIKNEQGVIWHQADLMKSNETEMLFKKIIPSHLLHFAWYAEPGKFWNSEENFKWVESSIRLLRFFKAYGGYRMVYAGTCAEFNWGQQGAYIESNSHDMPSTIYGLAKKTTQQLFEVYSQQFQLSAAWGRIFFLYGPNERPEKFLSSVIISMLQKKIIKCTHGNQMRDFLHVQDVASAFVSLLDSPVQGVVNISSGEAHSLKEIVAIAGKYLDATEYVHFGEIDLKNEPLLIKGSNERLLNEVGWAPNYQIETGILHTVDWWKKFILDSKMG
jgi:nucleoside-diphosphate-sugar epimerase